MGSRAADAAHGFLDVVWSGDTPSDVALIAALDRLIVAYHDVPPAMLMHCGAEPPELDWQAISNDVAKRFPDYGLYAVADPLNVHGVDSLLMADAIDDIADICRELRHVIWYADYVDAEAANWWFRMAYPHWGRHARELAYYLFARAG